MSEPEEVAESPAEADEVKSEGAGSLKQEAVASPPEEPQPQEGPAEEKVKDDEAGGDEENILVEEENQDEAYAAIDIDVVQKDEESDMLKLEKKTLKENDDDGAAGPSVSFVDIPMGGIRGVDEKGKSITSVMSYDTMTSVEPVEAKAKATLGSVISIGRRGSTAGEYYERHRAPKYMNSYKLEPDKPFHVEKVEKFMREILTEALENAAYDADKTPKQAKWASSAMRAKLKEQEYDRCKFVCIVTMGEKRSQDVHSILRFLWDPDRDKFAHVVHENMSIFAVAVCFGIYYE